MVPMIESVRTGSLFTAADLSQKKSMAVILAIIITVISVVRNNTSTPAMTPRLIVSIVKPNRELSNSRRQ